MLCLSMADKVDSLAGFGETAHEAKEDDLRRSAGTLKL